MSTFAGPHKKKNSSWDIVRRPWGSVSKSPWVLTRHEAFDPSRSFPIVLICIAETGSILNVPSVLSIYLCNVHMSSRASSLDRMRIYYIFLCKFIDTIALKASQSFPLEVPDVLLPKIPNRNGFPGRWKRMQQRRRICSPIVFYSLQESVAYVLAMDLRSEKSLAPVTEESM